MTPEASERLLKLAAAISDGDEIDWQREVTTSAETGDGRLVRSLRTVGLVARLEVAGGGAGRRAPLTDEPDGLLGELRILEQVGRGAYGDVYRAWDPRLEREVAVKILRPREGRTTEAHAGTPVRERTPHDAVERLLREGRRLAGVKHPNVVAIHSAETIDGRPAIRMEFVHGRTLAQIVDEQGPFGADEIASIGARLCRALAAVHGAGLVHRDVKAQNVMREQGGRIVLMDFGAGGATPIYSAPELLAGAEPSASSDLYSLGVLLYFLATGSFPITGESLDELRAAHARGRALLRDLRADLPPAIVGAIDRALAPDPRERFATAGEMESALVAGTSNAARRTAPAIEGTPPRERRVMPRTRALGAAVAGLAAALAVVLWLRPDANVRDRAATAPSELAFAPDGRAAGLFTIDARFYRGRQQRDALADGARVALGDSISLAISCSESVHVYVIDEDDRGNAYLLFPLRGMEPANPLPPRVKHVLPGMRDGNRYYWRVTTTGGREHIAVIASRERLVEFEAQMLLVDRPHEGREPEYARVNPAAKEKLRGLGGLAAERAAPHRTVAASDLFASASRLGAGPQSGDGVWIGRIDLENPER